ncbi:MAG: YegP family protein [Patescibacteria group bacterium]
MAKFVIKPSTNGQYYWVFIASNGETLCTSETLVEAECSRCRPSSKTAGSDCSSIRAMKRGGWMHIVCPIPLKPTFIVNN